MAKSSSKRKLKQRDKSTLKHKGIGVESAVDYNGILSDELRNECAGFSAVNRRISWFHVILSGNMIIFRYADQQVLVRRKKPKLGEGERKATLPATPQPSKSEQRKLKQINRQKDAQAKMKGTMLVLLCEYARRTQFLVFGCPSEAAINGLRTGDGATGAAMSILPADAIATLNASKLDDAALSILVKTSTRGGMMTASQRLRRDKLLQQAGVQLPADSQLLRISAKSSSPRRHMRASTALALTDCSDSSSDEGASAPHSSCIDHVGSTSSEPPKRDLSQRAPPTVVAFGRTASMRQGGVVSHVKNADCQVDCKPISARLSTVPSHAADAEELRRQLIASGEISGMLMLTLPPWDNDFCYVRGHIAVWLINIAYIRLLGCHMLICALCRPLWNASVCSC